MHPSRPNNANRSLPNNTRSSVSADLGKGKKVSLKVLTASAAAAAQQGERAGAVEDGSESLTAWVRFKTHRQGNEYNPGDALVAHEGVSVDFVRKVPVTGAIGLGGPEAP